MRLATIVWQFSAARVFLFFNQLLERARREDQFYAVGGPFADSVLVLTPTLFEVVRRFVAAPPYELPFLRTPEPPTVGAVPLK